ncbi:hypothetical protein QU593_10070 [Rossellomorea marisflavi]|uniref:hypothetical protein n=1 Tax=Rossellomorea marisflavi TaxID=189381 RepID=UPI0025B221B2|nr:hypothetical protein [Rossellomorea marisflavi]WJV20750.1 hypothetical protein QU593_10070 [Rossellomorea marisflavi]
MKSYLAWRDENLIRGDFMYTVYKLQNKDNEEDQLIIYGQSEHVEEKLKLLSIEEGYFGAGYDKSTSLSEASDKAVELAGESSIDIVLVDEDEL